MAVAQVLPVTASRASLPVTPFPLYINHRTVTTAEEETVPAGATRVIVTADADVWMSDGTAVVPASDVVDGSGSFLLRAGVARAFFVTPAQTISVISASGTAHVGFEYFLGEVAFS